MGEYVGLKIDERMGLGDGGNDIWMVGEGGVGVGMGNGGDNVKEVGD